MTVDYTSQWALLTVPGDCLKVVDQQSVYRSNLLNIPGIIHGFGTRIELSELAQFLGFDLRRFYRAKQVHGNQVIAICGNESPQNVEGQLADALITNQVGITLGVQTADCLPILFADSDCHAIGLAHAGWRGLVSGVIQNTLNALKHYYGCQNATLYISLGPCISSQVYQVGPEVAACFSNIPGAIIECGSKGMFLNLQQAALSLLAVSGVTSNHIETIKYCTYQQSKLFHSYRREGMKAGRQFSVVGLTL